MDINNNTGRLQRLKEVREQERIISMIRCNAYRKTINDRKENKLNHIKELKMKNKQSEQLDLFNQWQNSLLYAGSGHRNAKNNIEIYKEKVQLNSNLSIKRRLDEVKRSKVAAKTVQNRLEHIKQANDHLLELKRMIYI